MEELGPESKASCKTPLGVYYLPGSADVWNKLAHALAQVSFSRRGLTNSTTDQDSLSALKMHPLLRGVITKLGSRWRRQPKTPVVCARPTAGHHTSSQPLPPLRHHPVQHAQMQIFVGVQRRAKAVHKQHPAAAACRRRACARSRCRALHFAHRDPRHPLQTVWPPPMTATFIFIYPLFLLLLKCF